MINGEVIHNYSKYISGTVKIGNVLRDATLDELRNIEDFYKEGGRLTLVWDNFGPTYEPVNLNYRGKLVGVPYDANKEDAIYKNAVNLLKTQKGRIFLVDDPEIARDLFKILGPALMKNKRK